MFPHGAMVLDTTLPNLPLGAEALNRACSDCASQFLSRNPDTIILLTPHGISLSESVAVYTNDSVSGSARWLGHWGDYQVRASTNVPMAQSMLAYFKEKHCKADSMTFVASTIDAPLAWGEAVPLWFCKSALENGTKVVILAWPQARFDPTQYCHDATHLGRILFEFTAASPERIGIIFSCDMSHVHGSPEGTADIFTSPSLGVNKPLAEAFDRLITEWITRLALGDSAGSHGLLIDEAFKLVVDAKACGWSGFCALQSCLEALEEREQISMVECGSGSAGAQGALWSGRLHGYAAPTYYGMMAASFDIN